ncbi:MAG: hypothetical protein KA010_04510, partial [Saprospiraceae bacterium]|nr:hypothetical protein [Saprospiraceae bacterium]
IVLYKLPIVMADIGVVFLLKERLKTKSIAPNYLFAYALHPLILWEFSFNGHTECVMLFFLLLALRSYQQKEYLLMGLWMGFSIATKLTTGLVFLYLLFNLDKKKRYPFLSGCLICIIILFLPYFDIKLIHHLSQSIGLYFHTFEFNAGIYFLLRESIQALVGYNPIKILGPMLSIVALSIILYICVDARNKSEISDGKIVSIFTIFYLLSTTVHPWYLCIPIAFGAIQNSKFIWWWGLLSMYSYLYYPFQSENAKLMLSLSIYAALIFIAYHEYQRKRLHAE